MEIERRLDSGGTPLVALETTLLVHGVPASSAMALRDELVSIVEEAGARAALIGVVSGRAVVGMTPGELEGMLEAAAADPDSVPKANTANLGALCHLGSHAATTVSATMEIAAASGVRVFATGGLGGVHKGYGVRPDISADLTALGRLPVAVVASGVKSLLDVAATREALETLGVPVIGLRTRDFPAFYLRSLEGVGEVDAAFNEEASVGRFVSGELSRVNRGVVVANPIPAADELDRGAFDRWLSEAEERAEHAGATGRGATPAVLAALHEVSGGVTLEANLALVKSNARAAGRIAAAMR